MNTGEFWKNFNLGDELHIAGVFIYNRLRRFSRMRALNYSDEIFEVLYDLAVGLERLLKITVVFVEHDGIAINMNSNCRCIRTTTTHS